LGYESLREAAGLRLCLVKSVIQLFGGGGVFGVFEITAPHPRLMKGQSSAHNGGERDLHKAVAENMHETSQHAGLLRLSVWADRRQRWLLAPRLLGDVDHG